MNEETDRTVKIMLTNKSMTNGQKSKIEQSHSEHASIMNQLSDQMSDLNVTSKNLKENYEPNLNYEQLHEQLLSESEPEKVFLLLVDHNNFKCDLNKCVDISVLTSIMNILSKIQLLQFGRVKCSILNMIYNSKCLENLNNSLIDATRLGDEIKSEELFINCKVLLKMMTNPRSKELLSEITQFIQSRFIEPSSMDFIKQKLNNDNLESEKLLQMLKKIRISKHVKYVVVERMPQHYNYLSVYPVIRDITTKCVVLSSNVMNGSYDDVEHYIDVQFHLLREDFIAPIREGIQCYIAMKNELIPNVTKMSNMHIYFNTKVSEILKNNKFVYTVHFYTKEDYSFESKRFMYGSLLVLTNDNFNSMFFGTVLSLKGNILQPSKQLLFKPLNDHVKINPYTFYTMAESDAYYLPYMHVMKVLKTLNEYNFPMKSYIINGNTKPEVPEYIKEHNKNDHIKMYNINGLKFNILKHNCWPNNKDLGLDPAQYMAFKAALTEEFTVIQGPPGTGKTYIGLKIAKSIIENMYETNILINPILVVCYTNHALDQFLEGLINITENIIRIGGGCKSEVLNSKIMKDFRIDSIMTEQPYVIGLTTTGASKMHYILSKLKPPIVIVEEAAEVLESHIIASLTSFCQHLILIGDHKQLRPKTASFTLIKKFNFDVSLFERLVVNGFPCYTLTTQHRMRTEISTLMLPIYPFLKDHESVTNRSDIRGVNKNLYFIHHGNYENRVIGSNSYTNMHEVNFFMEFARYLFKQGYRQNQVTLLVTYREQLLELQKIRDTNCYLEDFQIECVDSYQGEENDIILLSLVRSNADDQIGFLNIQNRICVALSRARNGLYIMGNTDNLIHSSIWKEISRTLVNQQSIGNKLSLHCEIHKDWITTVCDSTDFTNAKCLKVCNKKMDCGHQCNQLCHYYDQSHKTLYRCQKLFLKTLSCGFKIEIECWMKFLTFECPQ